MAPLPLSCVYAAPSLVGPASSVGEDELVEWQSRYSLPSSVILRVPILEERASSYIPGEIAIYEAFFDSGLRGTIPVLIYLSLGINEVMFAYHLAPLNGGEGQFHLRPRSGLPIMEELPKSDRKGPVFNKKWQERYAFMMFPGSSYRWNFIAGTHHAPAEGERAVLRARQLHVDRRQVNFLVSETLLRRSSLWRDMSGGVTNDPFAAYQEVVKVMSAKKGSSSRSASGDEVMITGSRRSTVVKLEPSTSLPGKRPKSGSVTTRLAQQSADMARSAGSLDVALSNLNLNVFPQDGTVFPIGDPSELNPPAWRILIAIQNLGDLEYLSLGINEVLFAYHLAPLNGGEGRFHLRPHSGLLIVEELPKSRNRLILLQVDHLFGPVFSCSRNSSCSCGRRERAVLGARPLHVYRRQEICQEALPMILLQPIRKRRSHRSTVVKQEPSPSLSGKRPKSGGMTTRSAQQSVDMARSAGSLAVAFSNRNLNVFPQDDTILPIGDPSQVVQVLQGGLLWRLGIARDDQEVPRMIRKTCQVMRFWRQIEAREEGWVFQQDSRKKYSVELCPRYAVLPFFATNLGFFGKIVGRSTAVSYVPDLLCFLFSATNLGFFGKIVGRSTAKEKSRARFIALPVAKSRGKVFDFLKNCGVCASENVLAVGIRSPVLLYLVFVSRFRFRVIL
ncbi:hypothetical protein F2Q70_00021555 [Brassica cretica]|uniref:Uncharacterized protein n=1 Tax=Brassica cretica TaxID=69181 RepID=A0A8S9GJP1_BRACR|nr:hypothetical protein F2Q70_00021555 [Brassica cretica]